MQILMCEILYIQSALRSQIIIRNREVATQCLHISIATGAAEQVRGMGRDWERVI